MAEAIYRKPVDDDVPWQQKLANYAQNPSAGRDEYKRAMEVFRGKDASGDTAGANAAKTWMGQVNTAIGGAATQPNDDLKQKLQTYLDRSTKPVTPFQYDANSDPAYQSQKRIIEQDTARDMNNARVESGAVGMRGGSLQNNQLMQLSAQNQARLQNQILPNTMAQAYQRYRDQQAQEQLQNQNMLQYINAANGMNQQDIENDRAASQQSLQSKQANLNAYLQAGQALGYSPVDGPKEDWRLLFQSPDSNPEAFAQNLTGRQLANNEQQQAFQRDLQEAGVTGMYNNNPTMQKLAQDFGQNAENQRIALSAQGQAQSAANQSASLGLQQQRFDWERDPNNPDNLYKMAQAGKSGNTTQKASDYYKELDSSKYFGDETVTDKLGNVSKTGNKVVKDPVGLEGYILSLDLPDSEAQKLYMRYGLKWGR